MSKGLYWLFLQVYHAGLWIAAWFHPKAKAWVEGRRGWRADLRNWRAEHPGQLIWMHCASLGEFEQGRPILEALRATRPDLKLVLTFFSPSGYEQRKDYQSADYITYLPPDGPGRARQWLRELEPAAAIFVKYEFWYYHLQALGRADIPTLLIAASFRPGQVFFRWYGGFFRNMLRHFTHLFVQQPIHQELLRSIGIEAVTVAGDPRVDRVATIAEEQVDFPLIDTFRGEALVWIAGSSWPPDDAILLARAAEHWTEDWKLIIAPHDISDRSVRQLAARLPLPYCRYSQAPDADTLRQSRILILDTMGMLSQIYQYGDAAYIGGGFGAGIHNTLEPAAHGLPVVFGPRYQKFPEAVELIRRGGAQSLRSAGEFHAIWVNWSRPTQRQAASEQVTAYIRDNRGATQRILDGLPG
ncbi:MAG: 3-deoxy-D-manno-octulosonic acid transferase [Lewinella sp.]|nr:3-deoxy-D-manno-octulosonic acid transferase [Lewinella sp.]